MRVPSIAPARWPPASRRTLPSPSRPTSWPRSSTRSPDVNIGGLDMAPKPPNVRSAPAEPVRSSGVLRGDAGLDMAPKPPNVRSAPAEPVRSSGVLRGDAGLDMAPNPPNVRSAPAEPVRSFARGRLVAALAAALAPGEMPELVLVRTWLDGWRGVGLVVAG